MDRSLNNNLSNNVVGFPDFANGTTILTNTGTYTITQNGWLRVYIGTQFASGSGNTTCVKVNGVNIAQIKVDNGSAGYYGKAMSTSIACPVKAGDIIESVKASPDELSVLFYPNR